MSAHARIALKVSALLDASVYCRSEPYGQVIKYLHIQFFVPQPTLQKLLV